MTPNEWHRSQTAWAAQARCPECGASKAGLHEPGCQVAMSESRAMQNAGPEAMARMNAGAPNLSDLFRAADMACLGMGTKEYAEKTKREAVEWWDSHPMRLPLAGRSGGPRAPRFRRWIARLLRFEA